MDIAPNYHPTKTNHTWAARGFGADTLTLQAEELNQHCTPDPEQGVGCDLYISVYGWVGAGSDL
jgi:hypothetical protein